jgi:hypothetical protein
MKVTRPLLRILLVVIAVGMTLAVMGCDYVNVGGPY